MDECFVLSFQELLCMKQDNKCFWFTITRRLLKGEASTLPSMEQVLLLLLLSITLF